MALTIREITKTIKEALVEKDEAGIQPIIIPPLKNKINGINNYLPTKTIIHSFLRHKQYDRIKEGATKPYSKHLYHYASRFPILPLEVEVVMSYLEQFRGETGRH